MENERSTRSKHMYDETGGVEVVLGQPVALTARVLGSFFRIKQVPALQQVIDKNYLLPPESACIVNCHLPKSEAGQIGLSLRTCWPIMTGACYDTVPDLLSARSLSLYPTSSPASWRYRSTLSPEPLTSLSDFVTQ